MTKGIIQMGSVFEWEICKATISVLFFFLNRNSICVHSLEREHMVLNTMCFNSDIVRL